MLLTNINLTDGSEQFQYVVEYVKTEYDYTDANNPDIGYVRNLKYGSGDNTIVFNDIMFVNNNENIKPIKFHNDWYNIPMTSTENAHVPELYNSSKIRLYFPRFSVDTYMEDTSYALTISTWICGNHIILGSYIISRTDALACPGVKIFFNEQYHEYVEVPIIDPTDLIYSDEWAQWRQNICGESEDTNLINTVGSVLYCTLYSVNKSEVGYIKTDIINGGQNAINLTEDRGDFLNLFIEPNTNKSLYRTERPSIECKLGFNQYYLGDFEEYLKETYGIERFQAKYELVVCDKDVVYTVCESPILSSDITSYTFTKDSICGAQNNFNDGTGWLPGIMIKCTLEILNEDEEPIIYLLSNAIPLTENLYRYLVGTDFYDNYGYVINNVNLDEVDMDVYNINVVNKTVNQVVKLERAFDNKSNINQTIFYRVAESHSIMIHPEVTENICLNLDQYKHIVSSFILQIEGMKFMEIGRVQSGIMFKIVGNKLPKKSTTGTYYILDQDSNVITSGKYTYSS